MHTRRLLALASAATLAACYSIIEPDINLPPDAQLVPPLPDYAQWYAEVEACTGVTGDFASVRWFAVPHEQWWDPIWEQYTTGTWREPHDIYIADGRRETQSLVRHEMVHDVLQGGLTYDPRFERCSGLGHR